MLKQETNTFDNTAADKTLTCNGAPKKIWLLADQDCWVTFGGGTAAAAYPAIPLVANVMYGPFTTPGKSFSVIRDSADGNILTVYET